MAHFTRTDSTAVTTRSNAGQTLTVKVRSNRARGSKNSRVRFPSKAAAKMTITRSNLTLRQPSAGEKPLFLQRLSGKISRIVPTGHSQPHHARPKTTVSRMTINANADPARNVRLAARCRQDQQRVHAHGNVDQGRRSAILA